MRARGLAIGVTVGVAALFLCGCTKSGTSQAATDPLRFAVLQGYSWQVIPGSGQAVRVSPDHANYTLSGVQPGGTFTTTMRIAKVGGGEVTLTGVEPSRDQPAIAGITAQFAGGDKALQTQNQVQVALRWHVEACPSGTTRPARTIVVGFGLNWTETDEDGHVTTGQSPLSMPFTVKLTGPFRCRSAAG